MSEPDQLTCTGCGKPMWHRYSDDEQTDNPLCDACEGFMPGARPVCVFCNAPWTDEMIAVFDIDASHGEGSYDFGPERQRATVDITCSSCERLIYRKEFRGEYGNIKSCLSG